MRRSVRGWLGTCLSVAGALVFGCAAPNRPSATLEPVPVLREASSPVGVWLDAADGMQHAYGDLEVLSGSRGPLLKDGERVAVRAEIRQRLGRAELMVQIQCVEARALLVEVALDPAIASRIRAVRVPPSEVHPKPGLGADGPSVAAFSWHGTYEVEVRQAGVIGRVDVTVLAADGAWLRRSASLGSSPNLTGARRH